MKKHLLYLSVPILTALSMTACTAESNTLWENASPETSALTFYIYDGKSSQQLMMFDNTESNKLLSELSSENVKPVEDIPDDEITLPLFGIDISDKNGCPLSALWTNGYLIMQNGNIYEFDHDLSHIEEKYTWESTNEYENKIYLPCSDILARGDKGWLSDYLNRSENTAAQDGLSYEIAGFENNSLKTRLTNNNDTPFIYGEHYSLQVQLEGIWYDVPARSNNNYCFIDIAYELSGNSSAELTHSLEMFGQLPHGRYRICKETLSAEFNIPYTE